MKIKYMYIYFSKRYLNLDCSQCPIFSKDHRDQMLIITGGQCGKRVGGGVYSGRGREERKIKSEKTTCLASSQTIPCLVVTRINTHPQAGII